ncbi:MAG: thioredoxin domain-containing protein [Patescibacteria group bacterium]|nr:thioredoxin domain-containing protein [Patescibacteria group bacterium]
MKRSLTIPIAIAVGGVIIAAAVYISVPKIFPASPDHPDLVRPVMPSDHILGNPAAPAMIVVYCDFDSSFCKDFDDTLHQLIANEGANGKVAVVFREFPLSELHPNALSHARAAECAAQAGGNDGFWKFEEALFRNQPVDPLRYGAFASALGIPGGAFASCFADAATAVDPRIQADRKNALDMGANGTPYSILLVAGKPPVVMSGAYPYQAVQQLVDDTLGN